MISNVKLLDDMQMKRLFVLLGSTGVGKTEIAVRIARHLGCPVISADSRQMFREMRIGTAVPTLAELAAVEHYFIANRSVADYYSASMFEDEAIALIGKLHAEYPSLLLCGGSMMYIDAVCKGIDEMPTVAPDVRVAIWEEYGKNGLEHLLEELHRCDPAHYDAVDRQNYRRVIHAVEICRMTGKPYSSFRTQTVKERPFSICKIGLMRERSELFGRINRRVDGMMEDGLMEEARKLYPQRRFNALNTVGYKELFAHIDGDYTLEEAVEKIKRNTRIYARKQMTWFGKDATINWFHPDKQDEILSFIDTFK
jgi:tRNA dimethylallyltransferase